jgi:HAD superfamily hydrolase (TIGR01509 family)
LGENFSSILVSSENGCAKPDGKIYEILLSSLSEKAADALMIDDNPTNVSGAIAAGMGGIVFESCTQLRMALLTHEID